MKCKSLRIDTRGYGTQQIEEQIQNFFPNAKVDRMDWDSTRGKYSVDRIFEKFDSEQKTWKRKKDENPRNSVDPGCQKKWIS